MSMRTISWLGALLVIGGASLPAQALSSATLDRMHRVESGLLPAVVIAGDSNPGMSLAGRMRHYHVPGVSIAVIDGGAIAWAHGYGVIEAGKPAPVDTGTLFQAASISKPVAAMATLRLVQDGVLALDENVNRYLVSWKVPENAYTAQRPVTLRGILSHSAGLTVHGFAGYAANEAVPTLVQVLDGASPANSAPIRVDTIPGSLWRYSGGGFEVMQQMLQDVTGQPFPKMMHDSVLAPVGMMQSTYEQPLPSSLASRGAVAHRADGKPIPGRWHTYPEMAAAGLWTTPSDLARFAIEIQRALHGASRHVLDQSMVRQMLTRQKDSWGLGIGLDGEGAAARFSHGGANEGYRAMLIAFDSGGRGAVVMTNSDAGGPLTAEIIRGIARVYGWPAMQPSTRAVAAVDPATYRVLAGRYRLVAGRDTLVLAIAARGTQLVAQFPPWVAARVLHPTSDTTYFCVEDGVELAFERDRSGHPAAVVIKTGGPLLRAARIP
jgi:CubicO group peptidase (beta-lactamase class C family)